MSIVVSIAVVLIFAALVTMFIISSIMVSVVAPILIISAALVAIVIATPIRLIVIAPVVSVIANVVIVIVLGFLSAAMTTGTIGEVAYPFFPVFTINLRLVVAADASIGSETIARVTCGAVAAGTTVIDRETVVANAGAGPPGCRVTLTALA